MSANYQPSPVPDTSQRPEENAVNQVGGDLFPCGGTATFDISWSTQPPEPRASRRAGRMLMPGPVHVRDLHAAVLTVPLMAWWSLTHATAQVRPDVLDAARRCVQDKDLDAASYLVEVSRGRVLGEVAKLCALPESALDFDADPDRYARIADQRTVELEGERADSAAAGDPGRGLFVTRDGVAPWQTVPLRAHHLQRGYAAMLGAAQCGSTVLGQQGSDQTDASASAALLILEWLHSGESSSWGGSLLVDDSSSASGSWTGARLVTHRVSVRHLSVVIALSALPMHSAAVRRSAAHEPQMLAAACRLGEAAEGLGHGLCRRLGGAEA